MPSKYLKVGIAGFGSIGVRVGRALDDGIPGLMLVGVCSRDLSKAKNAVAQLRRPVPVVRAEELAIRCDIIVECAPTSAFDSIVPPSLRAGKTVVAVSGAALLERPHLIDLAGKTGGKIVLVSGALLGLDAVRAAAEGTIQSVTIISRKPPQALVGAPYVAERGTNLDNLAAPLRVFVGSARDGALGFPANVNVAAALSLAGIGADETRLEIWADPTLRRNIHTVRVESDSARMEMTIENLPSEDNPATGKITALSVIAALRGFVAPLKVGT